MDFERLTLQWSQNITHLEEVLELRKLCFPGVRDILTLDDLKARHLLVRNGAGKLVGTYRVTVSSDTLRFEAEDDFIITRLLQQQGIKAELSWACVDPSYRDGRVIHVLWRGLAEFLKEHNVRYVFGLASVYSDGQEQILQIVDYLRAHSYVATPDLVQARRGALSSQALNTERPMLPGHAKKVLPSLLRAYLMAGALVCLQPVFDAALGCYDFMTVLDTENLSGPLLSHFKFR
ncbi:MAG: GNAT family N-acetyltransferase [Bacillota bacterium]